jgi:hypothetical protein
MGAFRRHRTVLIWISAFALLGSVLAGAFGYAPVKKLTPIVDDVLGLLVICTSDGAREGVHGGGSPVHNPAEHCPACVTFAKAALAAVLVLLGIIDFPLRVAPRPVAARPRAPVTRLGLGGIGSRAPPLFA